MKQRIKISDDWLIDQYVNNTRTMQSISIECECSRSTIKNRLKLLGINSRTSHDYFVARTDTRWELVNDPIYLKTEYYDNKNAISDIAIKTNCPKEIIRMQLIKFGIKRRHGTEMMAPRANYKLINDSKWMYNEYINKKRTVRGIAKECKCSPSLITSKLNKLGIIVRSHVNVDAKWNLLENEKWMRDEYVNKKRSSRSISVECKCSHRLVLNQLKKIGVERRDMIGEHNHSWKGGISFEPYCPKFTRDFKNRVRLFFENRCVICGKHEIENSRKLCVHHVEYNKQACCDGKPVHFAALCAKCHSKTNKDRERWEAMLHRIIDEIYDGRSYYTKEEYIAKF